MVQTIAENVNGKSPLDAQVWKSPIKRFLLWAYCWHLTGRRFTQSLVDRLKLWEA